MDILTVVKDVLDNDTNVGAVSNGTIWRVRARENSVLPDAVLTMVSGGQDYSHQGPTGLFDALVRIFSRGETDQDAHNKGQAIQNVLETWTGTKYGLTVYLTQHMNENADYDDRAKLFRRIDDYRLHYRRA